MNVHLLAVLKANENRKDDLRTFLKQLTLLLLSQSGCRSCRIYESDQPGIFFAMELWESRELLDTHFQSPIFERTKESFNSLLSEPVQIHYLNSLTSLSRVSGRGLFWE